MNGLHVGLVLLVVGLVLAITVSALVGGIVMVLGLIAIARTTTLRRGRATR